MHEQSLIDNFLKKILQMAEKENASKVLKITVRLGAMSNMSLEHFKEHFDISAKGTIAENAVIEAEESEDIFDPNADTVILKSIDVAN